MCRKATVFVDEAADRRRFLCPRGHVRWEAAADRFRCLTCAAAGADDPAFEELYDPVTDVWWPRDRVTVLVGLEVLEDGTAVDGERRPREAGPERPRGGERSH